MPRSRDPKNAIISEIRKAVYNEVTKGEPIPPGKYNTRAVMKARRQLKEKIKEHTRPRHPSSINQHHPLRKSWGLSGRMTGSYLKKQGLIYKKTG